MTMGTTMRPQRRPRTNMLGFTLIEMLLVITIAGVLVAIGIPSYRVFVRNNCMTTAANLLVNNMQYARSEAIKLRTGVMVTAGPPGGPVPLPANPNEWGSTGWHVWADTTPANGSYDAGEELRVTTLTCGASIDETSGPTTQFTYGADGFIDGAGTFEVCIDRSGEVGRQISISATGRPRVNGEFMGCT